MYNIVFNKTKFTYGEMVEKIKWFFEVGGWIDVSSNPDVTVNYASDGYVMKSIGETGDKTLFFGIRGMSNTAATGYQATNARVRSALMQEYIPGSPGTNGTYVSPMKKDCYIVAFPTDVQTPLDTEVISYWYADKDRIIFTLEYPQLGVNPNIIYIGLPTETDMFTAQSSHSGVMIAMSANQAIGAQASSVAITNTPDDMASATAPYTLAVNYNISYVTPSLDKGYLLAPVYFGVANSAPSERCRGVISDILGLNATNVINDTIISVPLIELKSDNTFEYDENGDLQPRYSATSSTEWEVVADGSIEPMGTTRNIVPREAHSGSIGTVEKPWSRLYVDEIPGLVAGIEEAPADGEPYVRQNAGWANITPVFNKVTTLASQNVYDLGDVDTTLNLDTYFEIGQRKIVLATNTGAPYVGLTNGDIQCVLEVFKWKLSGQDAYTQYLYPMAMSTGIAPIMVRYKNGSNPWGKWASVGDPPSQTAITGGLGYVQYFVGTAGQGYAVPSGGTWYITMSYYRTTDSVALASDANTGHIYGGGTILTAGAANLIVTATAKKIAM